MNLGFELGSTRVKKEIHLEAPLLRQPKAQWVITRTGSSQISGSQLFVLVVRADREVATQVHISMGAVVRRKILGLIGIASSFRTGRRRASAYRRFDVSTHIELLLSVARRPLRYPRACA
jgi:hypothetical protein